MGEAILGNIFRICSPASATSSAVAPAPAKRELAREIAFEDS